MSCSPFRVEPSKVRLPAFPSRRHCQATAAPLGEHPEGCCRFYPERGWYVLGSCGHAHGWDLSKRDADALAARLEPAPGLLEEVLVGAPSIPRLARDPWSTGNALQRGRGIEAGSNPVAGGSTP